MDGLKPDKCFTCGCTKFFWSPEKGWACLRCDPPSPGILGLLKRKRNPEALETPPGEEDELRL